MQGAAGMIVQPPRASCAACARLTRAHDVLLIADEVAVGFGRTGTLFACEQEGVAPDFLCLAKGLTGGYLPLAATLTTDAVYRRLPRPAAARAGRSTTATPTPATRSARAAVALASLRSVRRGTDRWTSLPAQGRTPAATAWTRLRELPHVGDVRQRGLMAGIELVEDRATKEPFPAAVRMGARVCRAARERGVLLRPLGDVVVVMPPLAIDLALLDRLCDVLYNCLREVSTDTV